MTYDLVGGQFGDFIVRFILPKLEETRAFWEQKPSNGRPMKTYEENQDRFEQINEFA